MIGLPSGAFRCRRRCIRTTFASVAMSGG